MAVEALQPGSTIGILGGGQLGRFLAIAAAKLGLNTFVYAAEDDCPACSVAGRTVRGQYGDEDGLAAFARACDAVTFEFENVPARALEIVGRFAPVRPDAVAAATAQDRIAERAFLARAGLEVAPFSVVETAADLPAASSFLKMHGDGILKQSRDGYDGKGQLRVSSAAALSEAFSQLNGACVLEAIVPFMCEVSVIAVRGASGDVNCYDVTENVHRHGILRTSRVPTRLPPASTAEASGIATRIAEALNYVGVIGVEMFAVPRNDAIALMVNEIAPRVHNTGHWTLDACAIGQFENHIRAVAGWPLGSAARHSDAVMTNLIGEDVHAWKAHLDSDAAACLYLYGKKEVRTGRKLGHVTQLSQSVCREKIVEEIAALNRHP